MLKRNESEAAIERIGFQLEEIPGQNGKQAGLTVRV